MDLTKENSPQGPGALARRQARQNSLHMFRRRLVEYFRLVAGTRQDLLGKDSREVDEGARYGRHRNPTAGCCVVTVDPTDAMGVDARHTSLDQCDHLGSGRRALHQLPEEGRRTGNQEGAVPARHDGSEVSSFDARGFVPDAVHAWVHPM